MLTRTRKNTNTAKTDVAMVTPTAEPADAKDSSNVQIDQEPLSPVLNADIESLAASPTVSQDEHVKIVSSDQAVQDDVQASESVIFESVIIRCRSLEVHLKDLGRLVIRSDVNSKTIVIEEIK